MIKMVIKRIVIYITVVLLLAGINLKGQTGGGHLSPVMTDSLQLKDIISRIIKDYPSVKSAEEAINNANARIGMAKTGYYPQINMNAGFTNLGPVTKLTIPDFGTFQLYPGNNYSASIDYQQVVYDFGRTRQNIELENENKAIGEQSLEQVKQRISMYAVNNYYTLVFLQAAIEIKNEELTTLNEHLDQVQKMMATGSATEYQVLSTKVKISTVESQKVDLIASLTAQRASLNSLLGNDQMTIPIVRNELSVELPSIASDSLLSFALHNRDEVLLNEKKTSLAELRYDLAKLQNKPLISFIASGGAKNGYIPDLYKITPNYVVGVGLRIPIFDGMKTKYNLSQARSLLTSMSYESEITKRNVSNELSEAKAYMAAAATKVKQFDLQQAQALKAYSLAQTSFQSGVITNLDLLDTDTSLAESKLMLLKARIDYIASVYKFKAALGERIY
jgi:outer membrane protein TolC